MVGSLGKSVEYPQPGFWHLFLRIGRVSVGDWLFEVAGSVDSGVEVASGATGEFIAKWLRPEADCGWLIAK